MNSLIVTIDELVLWMCWNWNNFQILYFQRFVFNYSGIWLACEGEFSLLISASWSPGQKILCSLFSRAHFSAKCATHSLPRKVGELPLLTPGHRETKALTIPRSREPAWASHLEGSGLLIFPPQRLYNMKYFLSASAVPQGDLGTYRSVWTLEGHWRVIGVSLLICLRPEHVSAVTLASYILLFLVFSFLHSFRKSIVIVYLLLSSSDKFKRGCSCV